MISQTWNKKGTFLFDYENEGYIVSKHKITNSSYIVKKGKDIKLIKSVLNNFDTKYLDNYIGKINIKENEEYIWNYNNYFEKNRFVKPNDSLDWVVIGPTKFSSYQRKNSRSYKLSEGDFIKLGKITFLVRRIKHTNENLKETKRNNDSNISVSAENSNLNVNNSINEDLVIYNKFLNDNNYINTNNELLNTCKTRNNNQNDNNNLSEAINNKLKMIYLKLKTINEKQKTQSFKCRICFCEGSFEGNDPLISPCKCTGSLTYIHLNCLRKWLTLKVNTKSFPSNNIYCYSFRSLECEICKSPIPEIVEYRGKYLSLLDFKDIEPPYIVLQTMYQYNFQNRNISDYNIIFVLSMKLKNFLVIGRANNSDIRLSDVSVSRNHSIISYEDGNFYIDDIGSKFGTLILIQNNIVFLPYKEISIQTGKCHLIFNLKRSFLGCFKCYKNKIYDKLSYEDFFKTKDKKVYSQILENFNNNIVDPVEKFSSVNGSISDKDNNDNENISNNMEPIKILEEIEEEKDNKNGDDQKTERVNTINNEDENKINENINFRYMFENSINSEEIKNKELEDINENEFNLNNNLSNDKWNTMNINLKSDSKNKENEIKLKGNIFMNKLNNSFADENNKSNNNLIIKQNESNDILFNDIKSTYNNKLIGQKNNSNISVINIMNILKKNNLSKKPVSVLNTKFNVKFNDSSVVKKSFELPKTQRNNNRYNNQIIES